MNECPYCDERGYRWTVEEDPDSGILHTVGTMCDHKKPKTKNTTRLIAVVVALLIGLILSLIGGLPL